MHHRNEKEILKIIKFFPPIFVIFISIILTIYLYNQNKSNFQEEINKLEKNYIELNKTQIKYQVERIKERIEFEKNNAVAHLKYELKSNVDNAYNILNKIYEKNKDKSKEYILSEIADILEKIEFNDGRSYIFMYTLDGNTVMHPKKKYLEGTNIWNAKDEKGTLFFQEMNSILKEKNETYYSWFWKKNDKQDLSYEKIGFFKKFEPLNIFIGSGEYILDFEDKLKKNILKSISTFKYDKNGYFFILDFDGKYLGYYDDSFIGKTVFEKSFNPNINQTFKEMLSAAKKNGDYISYYHTQKALNEKVKNVYKFSYVDSVKQWEWIIGTGFYMDDFYVKLEEKQKHLNAQNNNNIQKILLISFISTLFILIVFINVSNVLEDKFKKYQNDIENQIKDNIKKDNILAHQSKMAAMGEMIGNIAHQWRQPLSTISTIVTGMKMQKELGVISEKSEFESLDMVNKHVQYLSHTIDDFRDFFKPQKDAKKFYISSAIEKTISLVQVQFNSKSIEIYKDIENLELNSLQNELIQVLINILNNARDELVKVKYKRFIFIKTQQEDKNIIITIKDNAGGIPLEILPNIFEPYFTTKSQYHGTGIGLFMSEEIVTKHLKGNIFVSNDNYIYEGTEYKGAVFKIILPLNIS